MPVTQAISDRHPPNFSGLDVSVLREARIIGATRMVPVLLRVILACFLLIMSWFLRVQHSFLAVLVFLVPCANSFCFCSSFFSGSFSCSYFFPVHVLFVFLFLFHIRVFSLFLLFLFLSLFLFFLLYSLASSFSSFFFVSFSISLSSHSSCLFRLRILILLLVLFPFLRVFRYFSDVCLSFCWRPFLFL